MNDISTITCSVQKVNKLTRVTIDKPTLINRIVITDMDSAPVDVKSDYSLVEH